MRANHKVDFWRINDGKRTYAVDRITPHTLEVETSTKATVDEVTEAIEDFTNYAVREINILDDGYTWSLIVEEEYSE